MCLHWYLGDGYLTCNDPRKYKPLVGLSTCGFKLKTLFPLMDQLKAFKPRAQQVYKRKGIEFGYVIILELDFLNYISSCPKEIESIYGYKWNI